MRNSILLAAVVLALACTGCKGTDIDTGSYGTGGVNRAPSIKSAGGVEGAGGADVGIDSSGGTDINVDPDRVSIPAK